MNDDWTIEDEEAFYQAVADYLEQEYNSTLDWTTEELDALQEELFDRLV